MLNALRAQENENNLCSHPVPGANLPVADKPRKTPTAHVAPPGAQRPHPSGFVCKPLNPVVRRHSLGIASINPLLQPNVRGQKVL